MYNLRPYQKQAIETGLDFFGQRKSSPSLMLLPTAAGKSLIISKLANDSIESVVVIQHTKELLAQNYEKLVGFGGEASIYSASFGKKEIGHLTYATIASVVDRAEEFREASVKNCIIDEAHVFPRGNDGMLRKFITNSGVKNILGMTATPFKLQTSSVGWGSWQKYSKLQMLTSRSKNGKLYKDIIHTTQIQDMLGKYWSPLVYDVRESSTEKLSLNSTGGDYSDGTIKDWWDDNNIAERIVKCNRVNGRSHVLIFVPYIEYAFLLQTLIENSCIVYSGMSNKDRTEAVDGFRSGKYKIAINVGILGVGFDYPEIDHIILGRPTASLANVYQWVGRGTRIHENKKDCLITDFGNNILKFGRIEELVYSKHSGQWQLYGQNNKQLTNVII